jgi:HEAT repeat protein
MSLIGQSVKRKANSAVVAAVATLFCICPFSFFLFPFAIATAQPLPFSDVVRDLRHIDPKVRVHALRTLREGKHPDAIAPIATLLGDPLDAIQVDALDTELGFFLTESIPTKRRVGLVVEVRRVSRGRAAFEAGPWAVVPRTTPRELFIGLARAMADDNPRVRLDATYALGVVAASCAGCPRGDAEPALLDALRDSITDIRLAAARVAGRMTGAAGLGDALIATMNDADKDVRLAAMESLGMLREGRAVQALRDRASHYGRGAEAESAVAALARIAPASDAALFQGLLAERSAAMRVAAAEALGRVGDAAHASDLENRYVAEGAPAVRTALAFALAKLGRPYFGQIVEALKSDLTSAQARAYLIELGPANTAALQAHLQDPEPAIRLGVVDVLGAMAPATALPALEALARDRESRVAAAATRAVAAIRLRTS